MLQPVASTVPVTMPGGLMSAAVMLMASRKNPVGVQVAACACEARAMHAMNEAMVTFLNVAS